MTMSVTNVEARTAEGKVMPPVAEPKAKPKPHPDREVSHDTSGGIYRSFFKRAIDISAVLLAVPVVLPVILGLAAVICASGGHPFYIHDRVGQSGKTFRMWKLRTMVCDADARMNDYLASNREAQDEWDRTQKLVHDPRVTRFGQLLRKSSLDELPQLWNVLKGEMSLVGPRPMMTCQQELYPGQAYFALRPGITGYWQTSERNRTTFEARAEYDEAYERDMSLRTDIRVLIKTVSVVLRGTGC